MLAQLRRWGVPPDDAEDCLHDVLLRVHSLASRFDPSRPVRPWVTGIARRVALERKRARRGVPLDDATEPRVHTDPSHAADVSRALLRLRRVSQELDAERRRVWLAHDLEDVPAPELARALRVPVNTVYSRLRLARRDVRAALERVDAEARHAGRRRVLAS
ncbi:MAG: RNA polymerase sigma factor [Sandaracinaceae bacterium]|nr:RNA polymerase sigma factor [Sandaracinaceae bacterium]